MVRKRYHTCRQLSKTSYRITELSTVFHGTRYDAEESNYSYIRTEDEEILNTTLTIKR